MKYCVNTKGTNVGYPYITTVAKNWAYEGVTTVSNVEDRLISYEQNSEDLKLVMKAIGTKRVPTIEEKELYLKWTKELGFELNVIIHAIKLNKTPSSKMAFGRLDEILMSYYEMKLQTIGEIEDFQNNKTTMFKLAKNVAKELGLYYESLEKIVECYISKWISMGFTEEAILRIAKYCFGCSVRKFEGMNNVVQKFYKLGLLSVSSLEKYFGEILAQDEEIKEVLVLAGAERSVNSFDREFYRNWKENWNFNQEIIKYGATLACEKAQPMKYLNGILATWNEQGVKTLDGAKQQKAFVQIKEKPIKDKIVSREYSKEAMNALFDSLEEVEI